MVTKRITLRDVITHVQGVKSELSTEMQSMEKRLAKKIDANTEGLKKVETAVITLTRRVDALEEDLTATIKDSLKIRRHVGMAVSQE